MKKYLSHWSAVRFWKVPFAEFLFEKELEAAALTECTVFEGSVRNKDRDQKFHCSTIPIPETMKMNIEGVLVVSPELMFVQLALQLDLLKLILLGLCLCAVNGEKGKTAVSSKQKLLNTVERLSGFAGKRKTLRALQYIENDCRSAMEALLFMFLTLPHSLGGYGFSGAVFNQQIKLTPENVRTIGKATLFADIYFKESRIVVEYNSKKYHDNAVSRRKDSERASALMRQNYIVFSVTTDQLYSYTSFLACVSFLSSALGKRIRIRAKSHREMHQKLRSLLPYLQRFEFEE